MVYRVRDRPRRVKKQKKVRKCAIDKLRGRANPPTRERDLAFLALDTLALLFVHVGNDRDFHIGRKAELLFYANHLTRSRPLPIFPDRRPSVRCRRLLPGGRQEQTRSDRIYRCIGPLASKSWRAYL